jgi:uracil-DNA glycosylase family 4
MKFNRNCIKCAKCPLREKTRVFGEGSFTSKIAFIGEAPGYNENESGRPFSGQSGSFFNWGLGEAGIFRYQSWVTNVIGCQPPGNKIVSFEGQEAIGNCRKRFLEELKFLSIKGVTILVALGATAAEALTLEGKITKIRGSVYERVLYETSEKSLLLRDPSIKMSSNIREIGRFVIIPTFHPSYLLRSQYQKKDGKANFKYVWIADLKKAKEIQQKGWAPPKENFNINPTVQDLEKFLDIAESKKESLAIDIETIKGFNYFYFDLAMVGIARNSEDAICIPILDKDEKQYWSSKDLVKIKKLLNRAFQFSMLYQNALYDVIRLQLKNFNISMTGVEHDIMLLHHSITPELPHDLGFIVSVYGDTPYWKDSFLGSQGSILDIDQQKARTYNLRDCTVLHQTVPELLKDLVEGCLEETYYGEALPLLKPLGKMMMNGVLLDKDKQKKIKVRYRRKVRKAEKELYEIASLPPEFNMSSDDDMRYFLYGLEPNKFKKIEELEDFVSHKEWEIKCNKCKKKSWVTSIRETTICPKCNFPRWSRTTQERMKSKRKTGTKVHLQLKELKKMRDNTTPLYRATSFSGKMTPGGKVSVSKEGILSYQISLQNRAAMIEKFSNPKEIHQQEQKKIKFALKWIGIFNKWNKDHKTLNDFTNYKADMDGRVRGSYLIHGTATGRLSMKEPNLMQVPKKQKDIREMFIAKEGYTLMSGDYINLEVHVLAHETGEPNLFDVINGKVNQHDENTRILFGIDKDSEYWEIARDAAKVYQFKRIQYGGGQRSTFESLCMICPEVPITFEKFKKADDAYFEKNKVLQQWQENVKAVARKERVSKTFLGRKRILMGDINDIERQALNTPIQGGAAGVINRAMVRIDNRIEELNLQSDIILQVHDQLIYEVKDEIIHEMGSLMKEEMERPLDFYGTEVSFPVNIEIGKAWGTLKKFNPLESTECLLKQYCQHLNEGIK